MTILDCVPTVGTEGRLQCGYVLGRLYHDQLPFTLIVCRRKHPA